MNDFLCNLKIFHLSKVSTAFLTHLLTRAFSEVQWKTGHSNSFAPYVCKYV